MHCTEELNCASVKFLIMSPSKYLMLPRLLSILFSKVGTLSPVWEWLWRKKTRSLRFRRSAG